MRLLAFILLSGVALGGCIPALDGRLLVENGCHPVSGDAIAAGMTDTATLGDAYAVASGVDVAIVFVVAEIVTADEWGIWMVDDRLGTAAGSRIHAVDDSAAAWSTWPPIDPHAIDPARGDQRAETCATLARLVRANRGDHP